ncbi:MAG TPA: HAMP domain-containing sensor histidine kinase [Nitrososphaeraceae archaeon]|nr:HAMP domain-containing sensor histidine kinase [Nitrososphaeraceae archaeon]
MVLAFISSLNSLKIIIGITIFLLIIVSISAYLFFLDNSNKIDDIALQSVIDNSKLQVEELAVSLSNKISIVMANLEIISDSPSINARLPVAKSLLHSGQKITNNLTEFYAWLNKDGKIIWVTLFDNKNFYKKNINFNSSNREHFNVVKSTLQPHITPVIKSITGSNTIFISYPIIANQTDKNTINILQENNNHNINFQTQQEREQNLQGTKINLDNAFDGTILTGINTTSVIKLLENQVSPKNRSAINLLDKNGLIFKTSNQAFNGLVINSESYNQTLDRLYDEQNQKIISKAIENAFLGRSGSTEIINDRFRNSSIISYTPVSTNGEILFYVMLTVPYEYATEVDNLILQQQNFAMGSIIIMGIIALLIAIILGIFNKNLRKVVEEKTTSLKNAIVSLEKSNEQLKQHDKMQQEFINIAAHELRTPTQSIMGYVEMIKSYPERTSAYLQPIERNTQRLYRLIQDILDITRIESGNLRLIKTTFDMNEKINNVIKDINAKKNVNNNNSINQNVELIFKPTKEPIMVFADKERIYQVISNLVRNAMKFIPSNEGKIEIFLEKVKDGDKVAISVRIKDNGKGIDTQVLPHLFEKFTTKSESGTGLGLYISKKIIEAHGGKIWGKNNNNEKGAEFGFIISYG